MRFDICDILLWVYGTDNNDGRFILLTFSIELWVWIYYYWGNYEDIWWEGLYESYDIYECGYSLEWIFIGYGLITVGGL